MDNIRRRSRDYVCPKCFYSPEKCKCDLYSQFLILIDYPMQYAIQELNKHGFKTMDCCAGHYDDKIYNTYVSFFQKPSEILPDGFKAETNRSAYVLRHIYKNKDDFLDNQRNVIESLNIWVNKICGNE